MTLTATLSRPHGRGEGGTASVPRIRRGARGFTLIQLGVVLGVAAILAAAFVPDMIETSRQQMAEKATADVALLHDTARLYYVNAGSRWPGEETAGNCNLGNLMPSIVDPKIRHHLSASGYLHPGSAGLNALRSPFNQSYQLFLTSFPNPGGCMLGVGTDIPDNLTHAFLSQLPHVAASCTNTAANAWWGTPAAGAGWSRCWAFIPRPGAGSVCNDGGAFDVKIDAAGKMNLICK